MIHEVPLKTFVLVKCKAMWLSKRKIKYERIELENYEYSIDYVFACCLITFHSASFRHVPVLKGILLAILIGFLLGYFLPKCSDDDASETAPNSKSNSSCNNSSGDSSRSYDAKLEAKLLSVLDSKAIENISRTFSSVPHLAASARDVEMAGMIEGLWKQYGFDDIELPTYEVLLSFPKKNTTNKVEIVNQTGQVIFETPDLRDETGVPSFLAYSASGTVEGQLVYVNYGTKDDFEQLRNFNMSLNDSIAIIRYGKIFRGSKVIMAYENGAKGVILYSDPADYAPYGSYSWWLPPTAVQRGSVYPGPSFGDPLTHGLPSIPGMFRNSPEDVRLPKIPVHVITYAEAETFLSRMKGAQVPDKWKGGLNLTYRFGSGFQESGERVRLQVNSENVVKNVTNVIGTIKGSVEPDRVVLIGSHRDAWTYGAVDSISGTSVIMELSRAIGVLLKSGWRPRRTLKFCSWSAEEYALIGSTEYVEENTKFLSERAVAYLNLDLAVCGNYTLMTYSSPLLNDLILDAVRNITDPNDDTTSLYDVMVKRQPAPAAVKPRLNTLGTFSDYASFYQYLAIPSIDWGYFFINEKRQAAPYPTYHTLAETYEWIQRVLDPGFKIHLTIAKLGGIFLLRLVDQPLLPMHSISDYTQVLRRSLLSIEKNDDYISLLRSRNISLQYLRNAVGNFENVSQQFEKHLKFYENEKDFRKLRVLNDQMVQVEKAFLYPDGLPGRPRFKHLIFAPSLSNIYASANFPGVSDALAECKQNSTRCNYSEVSFQISLVTHNIQQAATMIKPVL